MDDVARLTEDVRRLTLLLADAQGERDALRAELDRLNPEPCAVCLMRPAMASRKTCDHCRSKT
jgi:hypothetical protein